jgi:hypothetical protein
MQRCIGIAVILALFAPLSLSAATGAKPAAPSAAERMQQSGPEEQQLKRRTGTWTVKATFRPTPDAQPMVTDHLVVGIMPAYSFANESEGKLTMHFESLAFVGLGREVEGRMIRSNLEIVRENDDHEFVRQYWVQADGSARRWLAVEYEYTRRK